MHDPMVKAFNIKSPFRDKPCKFFPKGYRNDLITIWHVDPCKDGTDDSCGWFMRSRHGKPEVLKRIINAYERDWKDLFEDDGTPRLSTIGTVVNLFNSAVHEYYQYDWDKKKRFMEKHLYEIILFAENTLDSLHTSINSNKLRARYIQPQRQERILEFAHIIYGWILRADKPWYRHPKYHFWHWKIQVHPWQALRRYLFTRCAYCGLRFKYNETPVTNQWDRGKVKWFKSDEGLYHHTCFTSVNRINEKKEHTESPKV